MYRKIVRMSFTNINSTVAENIKFFMYKYNFTYHDWFVPLHVILKKIECYVINSASTGRLIIIIIIHLYSAKYHLMCSNAQSLISK